MNCGSLDWNIITNRIFKKIWIEDDSVVTLFCHCHSYRKRCCFIQHLTWICQSSTMIMYRFYEATSRKNFNKAQCRHKWNRFFYSFNGAWTFQYSWKIVGKTVCHFFWNESMNWRLQCSNTKVFRKIFGPLDVGDDYRMRKNEELYMRCTTQLTLCSE